ncbi:hypothetical protein HRI_004329300 [Hibiscus trionum]|uniref:TF-B3 domain-containing protein n=1 Tax=Hibiscus trionum TaxID=183268 RepID=A0A9W7J371_HIBTR|nr:hypothetical protein HRI_004329200 [Hibiscus trionum]GMJ06601.1 hypothetical protein HRI_004329300 [Hibiscus trionum]
MEDKALIPWSFINVGGTGTSMPEQKNHDSEETELVTLDLIRQLEEKTLSSSTDTSVPFGSWSLIDVGGRTSMSEEKNQDSEKTAVPDPLDLSLSLGMPRSSSSAPTDSSAVAPLREKELERTEMIDFLSGPSGFGVRDMVCMEKSSDSFLSDGTKIENVSLTLSLRMNKSRRFEVGECRNRHNLKKDNISLKKLQTMGNPKSLTNKNKRRKVEIEELRMTELRLGHDPWCIKKKLTPSDLGNNARLMVAPELVKSHILPHWNDEQLTNIKAGLPVSVWDCDTNTQHGLVFKVWNEKANVFISNWTKDFVKRRELKLKDEIGLYWDVASSRFNFSLLNRAPLQ